MLCDVCGRRSAHDKEDDHKFRETTMKQETVMGSLLKRTFDQWVHIDSRD